jgi:hypothetical protein
VVRLLQGSGGMGWQHRCKILKAAATRAPGTGYKEGLDLGLIIFLFLKINFLC